MRKTDDRQIRGMQREEEERERGNAKRGETEMHAH